MGRKRITLPMDFSIQSMERLSKCIGAIKTERNIRRRERKANEKAWNAKTMADGKAANGMPRMRRQANELARWTRDQEIKKRSERR